MLKIFYCFSKSGKQRDAPLILFLEKQIVVPIKEKKRKEKHQMSSFKIVVARYNEDIDWLRPVQESCIFYNKGPDLLTDVDNQICLENVGRESETYLRYVVDHYDNDSFPDVIVFTQGRVADHRHGDCLQHLLALKDDALENGTGKSRPILSHVYTGENRDNCWDPDWNKQPDSDEFYLHHCYRNNRHILFSDWFSENVLWLEPYPNPIHIYCNAIFAVRREHILRRPKEYYQRLLEEVNHHINPAEGHFFERSWYYIFS